MSGIWPREIKCVVILTFDIDGTSGALNRMPAAAKLPSLMSMREYGPNVGTPRILDLLDRYKIKASFYIPGYVIETNEDLVLDIMQRGHEIGHHGYLHEPPATLNRELELEILDKGIEIIRRLTGQAPKGYRAPSWELSDRSLSLIASRDLLYDSSLMGNDIPYMVDVGNGRQIVEVPVHWELDDYPYFDFAPSLGSIRPISNPETVFQS